MHALRQAYCEAIKNQYHGWVKGDPDPGKTELAANKVYAMGIGPDIFIELALKVWDGYAKKRGWMYPYWYTVIGDKSIERVKELVRYAGISMDTDNSRLFEDEVSYATEYVGWMTGQAPYKPTRLAEVDSGIKQRVCSYLCQMYGIPVANSYNDIAIELEHRGH